MTGRSDGSRGAGLLPLLAAVLLGGCDVPTEPPRVEQRWMVPVERTTVGVEELLPAAVTTAGGAFDVAIDPFEVTGTLGQLCGFSCRFADRLTVPVPEFEASFTLPNPLPADVHSAEATGGEVEVEVANGFSFDPLENGGTMSVVFTDEGGGSELGEVVFRGPADSLPPNTVATRTASLAAGPVSEGLRALVSLHVAGGQVAEIDTDDTLSVTATVGSLRVSSVTADVGRRPVSFEEEELDLGGVDEDVVDRIVEGSVVLDVANPLPVSVAGSLEIGETTREFSVEGSGLAVLPYTREELLSFVGDAEVPYSGSGIADGSAVTLRPDHEIAIDATLDLTLEVGGGGG